MKTLQEIRLAVEGMRSDLNILMNNTPDQRTKGALIQKIRQMQTIRDDIMEMEQESPEPKKAKKTRSSKSED